MIIKSLEQMEKIVAAHRELSWDGWTVVVSYPNNVGWKYPTGALIKGRWYVQKRFAPNKRGWDIPSKFVRQDG
jgi:hypothetical protein